MVCDKSMYILFVSCRSGIPHACLEGLEGYSHCWIIYIFHRNTDLQDLWRPDDRGLKAKVQVPKLNGKRVGVFATRTPHRPNPIGQSSAAHAFLGLLLGLFFSCSHALHHQINAAEADCCNYSGIELDFLPDLRRVSLCDVCRSECSQSGSCQW